MLLAPIRFRLKALPPVPFLCTSTKQPLPWLEGKLFCCVCWDECLLFGCQFYHNISGNIACCHALHVIYRTLQLFFWGRSTRWRGYGFFPVFTTVLNIRFFAWGSSPRLLSVCGAVVICHFSPYFDIGILRGKKLGVLPILEPSTFRLVLRTLPLNHSKLVASSAIYLGSWWQNACILRW